MTDRPEWSEEFFSNPDPGSYSAGTDFSTHEEIGDMHFSTENFTLAREYYEKAIQQIKLKAHPSHLSRLNRKISDCYLRKGHSLQASRYLERARELVQAEEEPFEAAKIDCREGYLRFNEGDYQTSLRKGFRAYRILKETDEHSEVAKVQLLLANSYLRLGQTAEAEQYVMDALASYRRVNDETGIAFVYNNLGIMHKNACRWNQAISYLHKALDLSAKLGLGQHTVRVYQNLGVVYLKTRDFSQAVSCTEKARRKAKSMGDDIRLARITLHLGRIYLTEGRLDKAERFILEGQVLAEKLNLGRQQVTASEWLGDLMRARGLLDEALQNYTSGLTKALEIAAEGDLVAELQRRIAELQVDRGDFETGLETSRQALRISFASGETHEVGFVLRAMGRAFAGLGKAGKAERTFQNSIKEFEERNLPYEAAWSCVHAARFYETAEQKEKLLKARSLCNQSIGQFQKIEEGEGLSEAYATLARVEHALGNYDESLLAVFEGERVAEEFRIEDSVARFRHLRRDVEEGLASVHKVEDQFSFIGSLKDLSSSESALKAGLVKVVASVLEKTESQRGLIALWGEDGVVFAEASVKIPKTEIRKLVEWFRGQSALGSSEESASGFLVSNVDQRRDLPLKQRLGSLICQPLTYGGEEVGFFLVHRLDEEPLGQEALKVLTTYSGLVGLSLQDQFRAGLVVGKKAKEQSSISGRGFKSIITENQEMIDVLNLAEKVARSNATVLLSGETGTGKGLVAYAVHLLSTRREQKFVPVNCAALPDQLLESELFGYVKGSFTGAINDRKGLIEEAQGGTLFLDEVGKTSLAMQGKLLHFLDRSEVRPVGSTSFRKVDVRVICASKVDLLQLCEEGRFLEDLYYRINDFPLNVPPLRRRADDVELLVDHYLVRFQEEMEKSISAVRRDAMSALRRYGWPGNVRELEKCMKRAVILADDGGDIELKHLPDEIRAGVEAVPDPESTGKLLRERLASVEAEILRGALEAAGWNRTRTAKVLGISYPSLLQKIKTYKLKPDG